MSKILKNVLVVGVFDLFHRGHLEFIKSARACGDNLFVVINGDEMTTKYKRRPIFREQDRKEIVAALKFVDEVVISNSFDIKPYIEQFSIDAIVHGDDWPHEEYLKQVCCTQEYLNGRGVEMVYLKYYEGVSTSEIIDRLSAIC